MSTTTAVDMRHTKLNAEEAAILAGEVEKPSWASRNEGIHERVSFEDTIWGFELAGGVYYKTPLRVVYVKPGSRADQACIKKGDTVLRINDIDTSTLTLQEAHDLVYESGIHLRIAVTSPDDEEDAYYCYKDPLQENSTMSDEFLRAMEAERIRKAIASATKNNNLKWPWVRRKMTIYRESNCYLVPSKYEGKHREKYPELPHVRYIDDISEVLNKREEFDKEKEEQRLKEEAERAELEKQRLKEEAEKAEKERLRLEMEAEIAEMDREREQREEQKAQLEKQKLKEEAERIALEQRLQEEAELEEQRLQEEAELEEQRLRENIENDNLQNRDAEFTDEIPDQEDIVEDGENEASSKHSKENEQNDESNDLEEKQEESEVNNETLSQNSDELLLPESETNNDTEVNSNEQNEAPEDVGREDNLDNGVEDFDELLNDDQSAKFEDDNIIDSIISENGHEETIESSNER